MGFCTTCGHAVSETSTEQFCSQCGTRVVQLKGGQKAGTGLSQNKGDDWLPSALKSGSKSNNGALEHTEEVLGEMINETNRVFAQLGVTVGAQKKVTPGPQTICANCQKPINGAAISTCGLILHAQCFTCYKCHDLLAGETYAIRNADQAWCTNCIKREASSNNTKAPSQVGVAPFKPAASSSSTGLSSSQRNEFLSRRDDGKVSCSGCSQIMQGEGVTTPDGRAWHNACAPSAGSSASSSGVSCTACRKPLQGKFVRSSNQAPYHRECFVCTKCKKDLGAGYTMREEKPYCGSCASDATPYIKSTTTTTSAPVGPHIGIRYNQVTREVTPAKPNCLTSPVKNPDAPSIGNINPPKNTSAPVNAGELYPQEKKTFAASSSSTSSAGSKFCVSCGSTLAGAKFCGQCGTKV